MKTSTWHSAICSQFELKGARCVKQTVNQYRNICAAKLHSSHQKNIRYVCNACEVLSHCIFDTIFRSRRLNSGIHGLPIFYIHFVASLCIGELENSLLRTNKRSTMWKEIERKLNENINFAFKVYHSFKFWQQRCRKEIEHTFTLLTKCSIVRVHVCCP